MGSTNRYFATAEGVSSISLPAISSYDLDTHQVNGSKPGSLSIFAMARDLVVYLRKHAKEKVEAKETSVFAYVLHNDVTYQQMIGLAGNWHGTCFKISQLFGLLQVQGTGGKGLLAVDGAANWIPLTRTVLVSARWNKACKGWYLNLVQINPKRKLNMSARDQLISIQEL